jgi:hypothetical protein
MGGREGSEAGGGGALEKEGGGALEAAVHWRRRLGFRNSVS